MRKIYLTIRLLAVSMLCVLITSCSKEPVPDNSMISVEKTELVFSQKGESKEFDILYPNEWSIEAEGLEFYYGINMANIKDFTIQPISGKGNTKVVVELKNKVTESYSVDLKIAGKNNHVTIKLNALTK